MKTNNDYLTRFTYGTGHYFSNLMAGKRTPKGVYAENFMQPMVKQLGLANFYQLRVIFQAQGFEKVREGLQACKKGNATLPGLEAAKKFSQHLQYDRLSPETKEKLNELCPRLRNEKNPAEKNKLMRESFVFCAGLDKNILHMLKSGMSFTPEFSEHVLKVGALKSKVYRLMQHPELRDIEKDSVKVTLSDALIFKMTPLQLEQYEKKAEEKLSQLPFLTPAGQKSAPQGIVNDPFNKKKTREHQGIDYGGLQGTPVDSAMSGKVVSLDLADRSAFGKHVVVMTQTPKGPVYTLYGHLSGVDVQVGQQINIGQSIGKLGSTGKSTGPHLHIEMREENSFTKGKGKYLLFSELNKILISKKT